MIMEGSAPISSTAQSKAAAVKEMYVEKLAVRASPNPSAAQFTLLTKSTSSEVVDIKIADAIGRHVERRTGVAANGTLYLGAKYRPGVYTSLKSSKASKGR